MSIASRLRDWLRRLKRQQVPGNSTGLLREFVYLDEVSVYSVLASRKGGIVTEFTESQTASLNSDVGGSLSVGFGGTKAKLDSEMRAGHVQSSQVLRKAIIQTSFKELYDIERASLALSPPDADCMPTVDAVADLEERLDPPAKDGWLVDPSTIRRGELLEVEVELEADPIFRMASVITTLQELMEDNENLLGNAITAQLPQIRSMAQVLEVLLVGLVPIRGRLVDYKWTTIGGRDVLIHRLLLEQISPGTRPKANPAFVVGVAQRDLFWKDIRRVLFSQAQYTVFCRLAIGGMSERWHPVKVADVLRGIVPQFDELIREFSKTTRRAMTAAVGAPPTSVGQGAHSGAGLISAYVELLVKHHDGTLEPDVIDDVIQSISLAHDWLSSVDGRRPVFAEATQRVDKALGLETSSEDAYHLRDAAMRNAGLPGTLASQASNGSVHDAAPVPSSHERFLDAKIIAIYWQSRSETSRSGGCEAPLLRRRSRDR